MDNTRLTSLLTHYALQNIEDFMQFVDRQTDSDMEAEILQCLLISWAAKKRE